MATFVEVLGRGDGEGEGEDVDKEVDGSMVAVALAKDAVLKSLALYLIWIPRAFNASPETMETNSMAVATPRSLVREAFIELADKKLVKHANSVYQPHSWPCLQYRESDWGLHSQGFLVYVLAPTGEQIQWKDR
jgi:hypothetical protein